MELLQELVFTISLSLIVYLLIAKLFSMASSCDDEISTRVEEKIEKEWVVCDSEIEAKTGYFQDSVKLSEKIVCRDVEDEFAGGCVIENLKSEGLVDECQVFDESTERTDFNNIEVIKAKNDEGNGEQSWIQAMAVMDSVVDYSKESLIEKDCLMCASDDDGEVKVEDGDEGFDDDWEGIERTELEKSFGAAMAFVGSKNNADQVSLIGNGVRMQLYGLRKVAIEGPCFEPQPMALKVSARAYWNAWKRIENISPEEAMEQYIALLSRYVPDWMIIHASEDDKRDFLVPGKPGPETERKNNK